MTDEPASQGPSPETTLRYRGELVRLAAIEPEADAEVFAEWFDDPMATRLAGFRPVWPMNRASAQERLEEWVKASPGTINFAARTIADDRLVGGIGLMDINGADGHAQLGLSIYKQDDWGHGYGREPMEPHDITMVVIGASLLWFGWFGFNAGSALGANGLATAAFVNTHVAAAMAALAWVTASWLRHGRPSVAGGAAGAVAGLVGITPNILKDGHIQWLVAD